MGSRALFNAVLSAKPQDLPFLRKGKGNKPAKLSPTLLLAGILDVYCGSPGKVSKKSLVGFLQNREEWDLAKAIRNLPRPEQDRLRKTLPSGTLESFLFLSKEKNGERFFQDLLHLGRDLSQREAPRLAALIFSSLEKALEENHPSHLKNYKKFKAEAKDALGLLQGRGRWQDLFEVKANHFIQEALSPIGLATMAIGSLSYGAIRLATYSRLLKIARPGFWARGLGAHGVAATLAYMGEVSTFVGTGRALRAFAGEKQDWSISAVGREWAGTGMMLGALRASGAGTAFILGKMPAAAAVPGNGLGSALRKTPYVLLPQTGMLMGIMGAHRLEEYLHLRRKSDGAGLLLDSLTTLLQFNVAGKILETQLGRGYGEMQRDLHQRGESLKNSLSASWKKYTLDAGVISSLGPAGWPGSFLPKIFSPSAESNILKIEGNSDGAGGRKKSLERAPTLTQKSPLPPRPQEGELKKARGSAETLDGEVGGPPSEEKATGEFQGAEPSSGFENSRTASRLLSHPPDSFDANFEIKPGILLENGKYTVEELIGEGGQGQVWRIQDHNLKRKLAMKVLHPEAHERSQGRFENEPLIGAQLDRRYNVIVYDLLRLPNGQSASVMEYVSGHDLFTVSAGIHRGRRKMAPYFPLEKQIEIFSKICDAVESLHEKGLVHRDLKPENIRLRFEDTHTMEESGVLLMDYGLAKMTSDPMDPASKRTIPPEAAEKIFSNRSVTQGLVGTPGYLAPETIFPWAFKNENPRSPDIFALGVILYEWLTGIHPFAKFKPGDPKGKDANDAEPAQVPIRNSKGATQINFYGRLDYTGGELSDVEPPAFADLVTGFKDPLFYELEKVARRGFAQHPADRYQSASEMRQAVLMAKAKVERKSLDDLKTKILKGEKELVEASPNQIIPEELTDEMAEKEVQLREWKEEWKTKADKLLFYLNEKMGDKPWAEAQRMVAEVSWERLLDYGERIPSAVRETWEERIIQNDVATPEMPLSSLKLALTERAYTEINVSDIRGGPVPDSRIHIKVIPMIKELDAQGNETRNYREGQILKEGYPYQLSEVLKLGAGFYVFEIAAAGYASMRVPTHVRLEDLKDTFERGRPLKLDFELVPQEMVPEGMIVVHRTKATIGLDFYQDGDCFTNFSFPRREIEIPTFLVKADLVSVGEYKEFIEDLLRTSTDLKQDLPKIRNLLPRTTQPVQARQSTSKLKTVMNRALNRNETYYWTIKSEGVGKKRRAVLTDPTTHPDPFNDPIRLDQPINAIPYSAMEVYTHWKANKDGLAYRISRVEELEILARGGPFSWKHMRGYGPLKRSEVVSYLSFDDKDLASPQSIGTHPMGISGDVSVYGVRDLLGNVRKYASNSAGKNLIFIFGGSIRHLRGSFFNPYARNVLHIHTVLDSDGGFYLALDVPH